MVSPWFTATDVRVGQLISEMSQLQLHGNLYPATQHCLLLLHGRTSLSLSSFSTFWCSLQEHLVPYIHLLKGPYLWTETEGHYRSIR